MSAPLTKTYEPNPALRALYRRFFDRIQVDESWVSAVRQMAEQGTVVYILRNLNFIDFFALDHLTKRYDLPQIRFANDLGLWILNPMGKGWWNAIRPPRGVTPADELEDALSNGGSAALFLKRPPTVLDVAAGASGGRGLKEGDELVRTLFSLQRQRSEPILLVPQVFVWSKRPDTRGTQLFDFLFGPREWPSPVRTVGQFLSNYRHVALRAGEPINLQTYLQNADSGSDDMHISRITYAMLRRLERERRSVTGPAAKPPDRLRSEIIRSPRFRSELRKVARDPDALTEATQRADAILEKMQATPDGATLRALEVVLEKVFGRIYAGVDVDREGLERVRKASKNASLVLLPSHKSHIDYLIISYVFNNENLQLPLIAAGENLAFFPLGAVFRRAGAFFIRRSFRGDNLYPAVVDAYVRRLIREGFNLELFLEGGRSRTGKLLAPKFGLLRMIVAAAAAVPQKVVFVPVSIGYERIVETGAYEREVSGGEKPKEDAAGLLSAAEILGYRYGSINLQFGPCISLNDIRNDLDIAQDAELTPKQRRMMVTRLGNRVMDEINRVTAVTPGALVALVLLGHHRRGLAHDKLVRRCERLLKTLQDQGARVSPALATNSGTLRAEAVREAAQMYIDADLIEAHVPADPVGRSDKKVRAGDGRVYTIPENKRIELDTSKNIIVHFFVERALVATAVLTGPGEHLSLRAAREQVRFLSRLFKYEFRFRTDKSFDAIFEETLDGMRKAGELLSSQSEELGSGAGRDGWTGHQWLMTYSALLRNFLEAYRIAARSLTSLLDDAIDEKELVRKALETGNRMYLGGEIERREAVSKPLLLNAFAAFADLKALRTSGGMYSLGPECSTLDEIRKLESSITAFLEREGHS